MARVLHLVHSLNRGGIETWLLNMLRAVPRSECAMDFCCKGASTGELASAVQDLGARVFHCPLGPMHFPFARGLSEILRQGKYDILHSHVELYSGFPVWLARRQGIPVIASFHNTHFPPQTGLTRKFFIRQLRGLYGAVSVSYALRHANLVTGCSHAVLESLYPGGNGIPPERSRILYYGVSCPELPGPAARAAFRASLGWADDAPLLLHVGRFIEQKNHLGVLAIFERVLQTVPAARLVLVGDGMLRQGVEAAIAKRGLGSHVRLLGSRGDVLALMGLCDVFLLPSLHEGFGLVAIEANGAGLPVVGSNIPGLTEAVENGTTALLHAVNDLDGMAASAAKVLTDRRLARRLADAGRARVQAQFSLEVSAGRLLETYAQLVPKESASERMSACLQGRG